MQYNIIFIIQYNIYYTIQYNTIYYTIVEYKKYKNSLFSTTVILLVLYAFIATTLYLAIRVRTKFLANIVDTLGMASIVLIIVVLIDISIHST